MREAGNTPCPEIEAAAVAVAADTPARTHRIETESGIRRSSVPYAALLLSIQSPTDIG